MISTFRVTRAEQNALLGVYDPNWHKFELYSANQATAVETKKTPPLMQCVQPGCLDLDERFLQVRDCAGALASLH